MIDLGRFVKLNSNMQSVFEPQPPQSARFKLSPRSVEASMARRNSMSTVSQTTPDNAMLLPPFTQDAKISKGRRNSIATFMESTPKESKSARFVPSPRGSKATKTRRASIVASLMTSPPKDEWGDTFMTSPYDEIWNKTGVTNMGFKLDEHDCISPDLSADSGFDDVMSPMTSPMAEERTGVYHSALSRRKSFAESMGITDNVGSVAPSNERLPLVRNNRLEPPKINYGSADERSPDTDSVFSPPFFVTSSSNDVMDKDSLMKGRSTSLVEIEPHRPFVPKPRSFSQPPARRFSSRLYSTLDSVSEEDVVVDARGTNKALKRSSPEEATVVKSRGFDPESPLIGSTADGLTIYPGYQSQSGISLNDWQVKLGEKEPEQCRCDKTPAPPPKKQPPKSASSSSIEYVSGRQVSIGDSVEGFLTDEDSQKFEGIVKTIGGSEEMSEIMEAPLSPTPLTPVASSSNNGAGSFSGAALLNVDAPPPSAGRRRKSLKTIFRLGFLTTKKRTKSKSEEGMPSPDAGPTQPPAGRRIVQRRMSRLEMNEPIEDIFSEVKFDIIQKRPSTNSAGNELSSGDVSDDDDDIIEDPEVILRSIMNKKVCESDDDNIFFDDVTKPATNNNGDVTNPGLMEKDLLLPETERNLPLAPVTEEVTIKITNENSDDDDLR